MNLFEKINPDTEKGVLAVIEVPRGSRNKYEYDKRLECLVLDRVLNSTFVYPTDYGFIPQTWYYDDDPMDVMVVSRFPIPSLTVVKTRIVGMMRMKDEKGIDDKLLAVVSEDPHFDNVKDINDLPKSLLDEIAHFFEHYKDLEKGKTSAVEGWFNAEEGMKAYMESRRIYKEKFGKI